MNSKVAKHIRRRAQELAKQHGSPEEARKLYRAIKKAYNRKEWE